MTDTAQEVKIATLEAEMATLKVMIEEMKEVHKTMDSKLDDLLSLKHKGAGAFWLASLLFGSGIIGLFTYVLELFKGH